jgi:hypothetical protein
VQRTHELIFFQTEKTCVLLNWVPATSPSLRRHLLRTSDTVRLDTQRTPIFLALIPITW